MKIKHKINKRILLPLTGVLFAPILIGISCSSGGTTSGGTGNSVTPAEKNVAIVLNQAFNTHRELEDYIEQTTGVGSMAFERLGDIGGHFLKKHGNITLGSKLSMGQVFSNNSYDKFNFSGLDISKFRNFPVNYKQDGIRKSFKNSIWSPKNNDLTFETIIMNDNSIGLKITNKANDLMYYDLATKTFKKTAESNDSTMVGNSSDVTYQNNYMIPYITLITNSTNPEYLIAEGTSNNDSINTFVWLQNNTHKTEAEYDAYIKNNPLEDPLKAK